MKNPTRSPRLPRWLLCPLLCLLLCLCSCGQEAPLPNCTAEEAAQALLTANQFSETLESVETDIAVAVYGLEEGHVLDCAAYLSTGATAEECTVVLLDSPEAAETAAEALQRRVEDQTAVLENYLPQELQKLSDARTGTIAVKGGVMAYLVVAETVESVEPVWNDFVK